MFGDFFRVLPGLERLPGWSPNLRPITSAANIGPDLNEHSQPDRDLDADPHCDCNADPHSNTNPHTDVMGSRCDASTRWFRTNFGSECS